MMPIVPGRWAEVYLNSGAAAPENQGEGGLIIIGQEEGCFVTEVGLRHTLTAIVRGPFGELKIQSSDLARVIVEISGDTA